MQVRRVYAAKLTEELQLEYAEFLVLVVDSHGALRVCVCVCMHVRACAPVHNLHTRHFQVVPWTVLLKP